VIFLTLRFVLYGRPQFGVGFSDGVLLGKHGDILLRRVKGKGE
jgi:hypothetical protein